MIRFVFYVSVVLLALTVLAADTKANQTQSTRGSCRDILSTSLPLEPVSISTFSYRLGRYTGEILNGQYIATVSVRGRTYRAEDLLPEGVRGIYGYGSMKDPRTGNFLNGRTNCHISAFLIARPVQFSDFYANWPKNNHLTMAGDKILKFYREQFVEVRERHYVPDKGDIVLYVGRWESGKRGVANSYDWEMAHSVYHITSGIVWSKRAFDGQEPLYLRFASDVERDLPLTRGMRLERFVFRTNSSPRIDE